MFVMSMGKMSYSN